MTRRFPFLLAACAALALAACGGAESSAERPSETAGLGESPKAPASLDLAPAQADTAVFAAGCFWCAETAFEGLDGVASVVSGFAGGTVPNPTYEQVTRTRTGHYEVVEVVYDPDVVSYAELLRVFWRNVDPLDGGGQFCDRGESYRSAIFATAAQRPEAEATKRAVAERFDRPIQTAILPAAPFYPAEDYHQDFWLKDPDRYYSYRRGCRRDARLEQLWGDADDLSLAQPLAPAAEPTPPAASTPSPEPANAPASGPAETSEPAPAPAPTAQRSEPEPAATPAWQRFAKPSDSALRRQLTAMEYTVTQRDGTEPPFDNAYWDNKAAGLYVDVVSGEPLFSSRDKYRSGTGWPSFTRPLTPDAVTEHTDRKLGYPRTEIRSAIADSHLGHVFPDGPEPTGLRYCMNSAAMRFIPAARLEAEGYAQYAPLFD